MKNMFLFLTLLVVLTTNSNASCFIQDINGNCLQKNQNEIPQPGQQVQGGINTQVINQLTNEEKKVVVAKFFRGTEQSIGALNADNDLISNSSDGISRSLAYQCRGDYYRYWGNLGHAISDYNKSIETNFNSSFAYQGRGNAYYLEGDYSQAVADFTKSNELAPFAKTLSGEPVDQEWFLFNYLYRGIVYYVEGDYTSAIVDFNKFIKNYPYSQYCYYFRGRAYDHLGKHDQAIADYNTAVEKEREANNETNGRNFDLDIENMVNSL